MKKPILIGEVPLTRNHDGALIGNMGSVFLGNEHCDPIVVTGMGPHTRLYTTLFERYRRDREVIPDEEMDGIYGRLVDLIFEDDTVLIRPSRENMENALQADSLLQKVMGPGSEMKIKFLNVTDTAVSEAIKKQGNLWRIASRPITDDEISQMITTSKIAVSDRAMFYYNMNTGTRQFTYNEFARLATLDNEQLRKYICEVVGLARSFNKRFCPELEFFMVDPSRFGVADLEGVLQAGDIRQAYETVQCKFYSALAKPEFAFDDIGSLEWRTEMYDKLSRSEGESLGGAHEVEEQKIGLSREFQRHIRWKPGATLEYPLGKDQSAPLIFFDSAFDGASHDNSSLDGICDAYVREFIRHFVRTNSRVQYINIGTLVNPDSLSKHSSKYGMRDVYVVLFKSNGDENEKVNLVRIQKYNAWTHLDEGKEYLVAIEHAFHYNSYVMDRFGGAIMLGVNVAPMDTGTIPVRYLGKNKDRFGKHLEIPLHFFQREYVHGFAADKIPKTMFKDPVFAYRFFEEMAKAAAADIIAGRLDYDHRPLFDVGHEIVTLDKDGIPNGIKICSLIGLFGESQETDLESFAPLYAKPVIDRKDLVEDPKRCAEIYITSFINHFQNIKNLYLEEKGKFRDEFKERPSENHNFLDRWHKALDRLERTDDIGLGGALYRAIEGKI